MRVEVLVDGRLQPELSHGGRQYLQAHKGKEYSIRLSNDSAERVAVALAVDGLNTIDGKRSTASEASKWVIGPWESISVDGWQVNSNEARRFVFTSEEKSYGAWRGETRNLGVIDAVVFGERTPCCVDHYSYDLEDDRDYGGRAEEARERRRPMGGAGKSSEPMADASSAPATPSARSGGDSAYRPAPKRKKAEDELAATGSGRKTRNSVEWTQFDLDPSPRGTASLRYGFRSELIALGVIVEPPPRRALDRRQSASGFAPEPPPHCCR